MAEIVRFESKVESRGWMFCLILAAASAVVLWLAVVYSIAFVLILGVPPALGFWSVLKNRTWRTLVADGLVVWEDSGLFFGSRRSVRISDIASIEVKRLAEDDIRVSLWMEDGRRNRFDGNLRGDAMKIVFAIVEAKPEIQLKYT